MTETCRLAVLNPNAATAMTAQMVASLQQSLGAGAKVTGYTNTTGPAAIEGPEDGAACLPGLFASYDRAVADGAQAVIIGCFDDTGLGHLRATGPVPVIGLGEAGCLIASLSAPEFVVVTSVAAAIPVIAANIAAAGLAPRCAAVRAADVPVLALAARLADLDRAIAAAHRAHPAAAIVLGCGGMTAIKTALAPPATARLVDPVVAAGQLARAILAR